MMVVFHAAIHYNFHPRETASARSNSYQWIASLMLFHGFGRFIQNMSPATHPLSRHWSEERRLQCYFSYSAITSLDVGLGQRRNS